MAFLEFATLPVVVCGGFVRGWRETLDRQVVIWGAP